MTDFDNSISEKERTLLIVDDNERFARTLADEFRDRGYEVQCLDTLKAVRDEPVIDHRFAVVDLRIRQDSGLDVIATIKERSPDTVIVVLTGYGSITTAVDAGRLGAVNYIAKPADADMVLSAFTKNHPGEPGLPSPEYTPPSLARTEWEHINRVLADCGGNISEAARKLGLHRRTLQRKLKTLPPDS